MPYENLPSLVITSSAFLQNGSIPVRYTCDGENINPPIHIHELPKGTESLVLIMDDPDAPRGTFLHWLTWDIAPVTTIGENTAPGKAGLNGGGKPGYTGPCPPSGEHRYFFHVYALDVTLDLLLTSSREMVEDAMEDHVIGYGELMGVFSREK